jgi:hypothetical protein
MNKKRNNISILVTLVGFLLIIVSCGKKESDEMEAAAIAGDDNIANSAFLDLKDAGDQAGMSPTTKSFEKSKDTCVTVKFAGYDTITKSGKIIVDFGDSDCTCKDAKKRRGKISIDYKGANGEVGSEITYTPIDYFVNDYGISGVKKIKYTAPFTYSIQVENGKVTKTDGKTITWNSERVRKMIAGQYTINPFDDTYEVTGVTSGENGMGKKYTFTIQTPLIQSTSCQWTTSGVLKMVRDGKKEALLDFGDGTCDEYGKLIIGSHTKQILLKKW